MEEIRPLHVKQVPGQLIDNARKLAIDDHSNLRLRVIELLSLTQDMTMQEIQFKLRKRKTK